MSDQYIFCEKCGFKNTMQNNFCEKCGSTLPKIGQQPQNQPQQPQSQMPPPNQYSNLSNFGGPQSGAQPIQMSQIEPWNEGGLLTASKLIFTDTDRVSPSLIIDTRAPSSSVLVYLNALILGVFTYLQTIRATYILSDEVKNSALYSGNYSASGISTTAITAAVFAAVGIIISWLITSFIEGHLLKGGFPYGHPMTMNMSRNMRQLNGFRYIPQLLTTIIMVVFLQFQPKRVYNVKLEKVSFLGQVQNVPVPSLVTDFSTEYILTHTILGFLAIAVSLYLLYKVTKSLNYRGSWVAIIIFLQVIFTFGPLLGLPI